MILTDEQKAMLDGKYGEGAAYAMKIQVGIGECFDAERMVPSSVRTLPEQSGRRPVVCRKAGQGRRALPRGPDGQPGFCTGHFTGADLLRGAFRVIAEAAASVGSTQIRNRATIGGNIANASPAADLAASLIALNASAHILREGAVFDLPVSELITGVEKTVLRPLDILLGFTLPAFPKETESHYYKLGSREQLSISRFGVAMVLRRTQGLVEQANIAIGAIGAKAARMPELERALIGRRVDTSSADALGDLLADYIRNTSRRQYKAWASRGVMEDALVLFTQDN